MLRELLIIFLSSFAGTLGFAVLLRAPRRTWIPASLVGALAFSVYWSLNAAGLSEVTSIFCGSMLGSLLGHRVQYPGNCRVCSRSWTVPVHGTVCAR